MSSITLPKSVLDDLYAGTAMKYINFVASTILVYDIIITMPDEIKYIWNWRWGLGKFLYFLTRYSVFIDIIIFHIFWFKHGLSARSCEILFTVGCWSIHAGIIVAQFILVLRTYAIWHQSRTMLIILCILVLGVDIPTFFILRHLLETLKWARSPFPSIAICDLMVPKNNLYVNFLLIMLWELSLVLLSFWKVIRHRKEGQRNGLIAVMYRDGLLFFTCLFCISLCNSAIQINSNLPDLYIFLLPELQRVMHSVLTARVIRHLREYTHKTPDHETVEVFSTIKYRTTPVTGPAALASELDYGVIDEDLSVGTESTAFNDYEMEKRV